MSDDIVVRNSPPAVDPGAVRSIDIEVIQGVYGACLIIDSYRVAGEKPWGGGIVIQRWSVPLDELVKAVAYAQRRESTKPAPNG